jgi:hypothetical protein
MRLDAVAVIAKNSVFGVAFACMVAAPFARAATPDTAQPRVLVELFTSEGCSSCPPVDALLEQWDKTQPLAGAQMIVLSEHVDYWDHDGWKDPYSSAAITDRQDAYVRVMGLNSPYTPQVIVDGTSVLKLSDEKQVEDAFDKAKAAPQVPVTLGKTVVGASTPGILDSHVDVDGTSATKNADIYAAVALNQTQSQVTKGENSGHLLTNVAVVQQIQKIGKLEKGKTVSKDIRFKLEPGTDPKNLRLVVFVQESGPGRVIGVAQQKLTE